MTEKHERTGKSKEESGEKDEAGCADPSADRTADEELYTRNVLIRGEAAKRGEDGELPAGATHEIIEDAAKEGELPKVERRRYSAY